MLTLMLVACAGAPDPNTTLNTAPNSTPEAGSPSPDILLVTIDTLRADHTTVGGYHRATTPALSALAERGTTFGRAYAQSGWTLAAFASLLSGRYPHQHRVVRDASNPSHFGRLPADAVTLAEALGARGYRSAAFVNNTFLAPEFGLQQGFDRYDYMGATNVEHRSAVDTVDAGLAWLDGGDDPAFLWLHFMEPHMDYRPPASARGTFAKGEPPAVLRRTDVNPFTLIAQGKVSADPAVRSYVVDLYDEEVLAADQALARFVGELDARGRTAQSLIVVTSDHGEEFWDHGGFEHGHSLMSELTRVPLVVAGPGIAAGAREDRVVEHVDLFQGLLQVAGGQRPEDSVGDDLFALPDGPRMSLQENCLYGPPCVSILDTEHRLTLDQAGKRATVWALDAAGAEIVPVQGADQRPLAHKYLGQMEQRRGDLNAVEAASGPEMPSYEVFTQLAALGYLDAPPADGDAPAAGVGQQGEGDASPPTKED